MKIEMNEFIDAVKEEILCYEGTEDVVRQWEENFRKWLSNNKEKKDVIMIKGVQFFKIQDEEEIFEVANSYLEALEEQNEAQYWKNF